jgi:hypothetical protein
MSQQRMGEGWWLIALGFALYGANLGDGWLADDYLYWERAGQGLGAILRHVTLGSEPQMLRPWPALIWWLGSFAGTWAGVVLHLVSVLLHGCCALCLLRLAARCGATLPAARLLGVLFLCCPLFGEPVLWLSASFDLWACAWALLALDLATRPRPATPRVLLGTAGVFGLALASKESVLLLPLLLLLLPPAGDAPRDRRRHALAWAGLLACYLAGRFALFGGPGGYRNAVGERFALDVEPLLFLRNLCLQIPYRLLHPLKSLGGAEADPWSGPLAFGLVLLLAALLWHGTATRATLPRHVGRAALLFAAAALPTATVLSVDAHLGGGRLVYFPFAVALLGLAPIFDRRSRPALAAGWTLAVAWAAIAVVNAADWRLASRHFERTLATLATLEGGLEPGSGLLVAGPDAWRGVPVWRNVGYAFADAGLRQDVAWLVGSAAVLDEVNGLGTFIREVQVEPDGSWREWTGCQRHLLAAPPALIHELTLRAHELETPVLPAPAPIIGIRLRGDADGPASAGRLWWRQSGQRFLAERSVLFRWRADGSAVVRLPAPVADALALRVQLDDPAARALPREVELLPVDSVCSPPSHPGPGPID